MVKNPSTVFLSDMMSDNETIHGANARFEAWATKAHDWTKSEGRYSMELDIHQKLLDLLNPVNQLITETIHDTGCRISEVVRAVHPEDLDPERKVVWVQSEKQAETRYRPAPLTDTTYRLLQNHIKANKIKAGRPIFTHSRQAVEGALARASAKLGLNPKVSPHVYRHWKATRLIHSGAKEAMIMAVMGWSSPEMILRYYAPSLNDVVAAGHLDFGKVS